VSFKVHIIDNWPGLTLDVYLAETSAGGTYLHTHRGDIKPHPSNATLDSEDRWFHLSHAAAPVLLAALARQLGAVEHPAQLRRDYEDERRRVDRMINHLIGEGHIHP